MASMISVAAAKQAIRAALPVLGVEEVSLEQAAGRIAAAPVVAGISQPPFNASAMDGYAVRFEDAARQGARLKVIGGSSAGERFDGALPPGGAVRIFTGAPVPAGADHVLIQENAERDGDTITVARDQARPQNIRARGCDFTEGETLIASGVRLSGPLLALAAAGGAARLSVHRRPRLALIANGDELVLPGAAPGPDQIICSIPFGLKPMIEGWGGEAAFLGVAPDDKAAIRAMVEQALAFDMIVPIGGASVGDRDYMRAVFSELGFRPEFEKVSVKPGKPVWFALKDKTAAIGLPGNPASALVTAALFVKTAIQRMLGVDDNEETEFQRAKIACDLDANGPRETYMRARLSISADGVCIVTPFRDQDSSLQTVIARSNVLIRRAENAPPAAAGDLVDCAGL